MRNYLKYFLLLGVLAIGAGVFMYNKPHKNMESATAEVVMTASEIFAAFEADETKANKTYNDKVVALSGKVQAVKKEDDGTVSVTLDAGNDMAGVICQFDPLTKHKRLDFKEGEIIKIKGNCTGMLMDVILTRCVEM